METYDVVVVGAGLAGLQCARLLGQKGFGVLLVDQKPSLDQSIHTTGIFVRRTLEDFAFPEDCLGPAVRHVTLYSPARRILELESPHDEFRVGRMGLLYQRCLNNAQRAGVKWMPSTRYSGAVPWKEDLIVKLQGDSFSRWVRTRYLVGADGVSSRVACDLELDRNQEWIVGVEEVFEDVPLDGPPRFHCFLDPLFAPGYLAWLVHDGETVHAGVGGYPARFEPLSALQKFQSSVRDIADLSRGRMVERRGGRIPVGGVLRRIAGPRGLLVGDAAGAVSPLTAGGLDPCMRLSNLAASVISDYLETKDPHTLATYSGESFRSRFALRLLMRRAMATIKSPALLELGCGLLSLPFFNSIAWQVFFGRGSFPSVEDRLVAEPSLEF